MTCFYYGKDYHKKQKCIFFKRDKKIGLIHLDLIDLKKKLKEKITTTTILNNENVFLISEVDYVNVVFDDYTWIIDIRAYLHVTPHEGFFFLIKKEISE